jgi:hypothetical protein
MSLANGRFTWRHNQVLEKIVQAVHEATTSNAEPATIKKRQTYESSLLHGSSDWTIAADLPGKRLYPKEITDCGVKPDIIVMSNKNKTIIVIELTVPYESRMSESHELKLAKYEDLASQLQKKGYKTHLIAVEVGARGFAGASVYNLLERLA